MGTFYRWRWRDGGATERIPEIAATDRRIHFFPFEKGENRGVTNRDHLLKKRASGRIVTYLCDRDLYFPFHLEVVDQALQAEDCVITLPYRVNENWSIGSMYTDLSHPMHRDFVLGQSTHFCHGVGTPLSSIAHTLEAYKKLPLGWSSDRPPKIPTDMNFMRQFVSNDFRTRTVFRFTFAYFSRGPHPGAPVEDRARELKEWWPRIKANTLLEPCHFTKEFIKATCQRVVELELERSRRIEAEKKKWLTRLCKKWIRTFRKRLGLPLEKVEQ